MHLMGVVKMNKLNNKEKFGNINLQSLTLYIGAVAIIVIFTVVCRFAGQNFLKFSNIQNIITQSSVIALAAIGESIVILTGGIDLSIGSIVGFVGIFAGIIIKSGVPIWIACLIAIIAGGIIGLLNGIFVSLGKVPSFITTLGTMQVIRGLTMLINSGQPVSGLPTALSQLVNAQVFGIPITILYVFVLYAFMIVVMEKTKFGKHIYAIGGNPKAAKLSGVRAKKIEILAYIIGGIFAAVAGVVMLSRLGYADPTAGNGFELDAIAAVVIGGIALSGGKGKIGNTLLGALILGALTCGLQILNVAVYFQTIITGLAIIAAVFLDKAKERKEE